MQVSLCPGQTLHTSTTGSSHAAKKVQKNFKNNYASVECGAKMLSANSEAKVRPTSPTWPTHKHTYSKGNRCYAVDLYKQMAEPVFFLTDDGNGGGC